MDFQHLASWTQKCACSMANPLEFGEVTVLNFELVGGTICCSPT